MLYCCHTMQRTPSWTRRMWSYRVSDVQVSCCRTITKTTTAMLMYLTHHRSCCIATTVVFTGTRYLVQLWRCGCIYFVRSSLLQGHWKLQYTFRHKLLGAIVRNTICSFCWSISKGVRSWTRRGYPKQQQHIKLSYIITELSSESWWRNTEFHITRRLSADVPLTYNASSIYGTPKYKMDHLRRILEYNQHSLCSSYMTIPMFPLLWAWQGTITQGWYIATS